MLIVRDAFLGVTRFDEFQRRLGISRNILQERLTRLVDAGVLVRVPVLRSIRLATTTASPTRAATSGRCSRRCASGVTATLRRTARRSQVVHTGVRRDDGRRVRVSVVRRADRTARRHTDSRPRARASHPDPATSVARRPSSDSRLGRASGHRCLEAAIAAQKRSPHVGNERVPHVASVCHPSIADAHRLGAQLSTFANARNRRVVRVRVERRDGLTEL